MLSLEVRRRVRHYLTEDTGKVADLTVADLRQVALLLMLAQVLG